MDVLVYAMQSDSLPRLPDLKRFRDQMCVFALKVDFIGAWTGHAKHAGLQLMCSYGYNL